MKYKIERNSFSDIQKFMVVDTEKRDEGETYIMGWFKTRKDAQKEIDTLLEEEENGSN